MPLPRITDADNWPDEILEDAKEFFNASISVVKPGALGTYDPTADTYTGAGSPAVIITQRAARIQHIRLPVETADGNSLSVKRRIRVQCEILPGDPLITKGLVVKVHDGGRDHTLEDLVFQVTSAINSSHAALRTIEAVTEGAVAA